MKEARKIACVAVNIGKHSETHCELLSAALSFVILFSTKCGEIKSELTSRFDNFVKFCYTAHHRGPVTPDMLRLSEKEDLL